MSHCTNIISTCTYKSKKTEKCPFQLICCCCICANNKYVPQMPHICQICQLLHVQIPNSNINIYTSHVLTAINNVTRSTGLSDNYISTPTSYEHTTINNVTTSTGIHNFTLMAYIPKQICLPHCTYMFYCTNTVLYNVGSTVLLLSVKTRTNCTFKLPCYYHISANNTSDPQMSHIYQLPHVQITDNNISIYTSYELQETM